ncbi:MAG: dTDP-4-dehydrorhamnose 3,5-epimerase [Candidatus Eremiobacteraeota bacterium]|nr:dTDP-4-dehydrorhamnose 3,5-epimerase [Candidatus Eremiobacteraeota bacterium]
METQTTKLTGVMLITPRVLADDRGYFKETFAALKYADLGIAEEFVQDNVSFSRKNVLRGMHYDRRMSKLVQTLLGSVFDVCVDLREDSPTYKEWVGFELSAENHRQIFIPAGVAHGFLALSDGAIVMYKQTALYDPSHERAISWQDASVGIEWPLNGCAPILSEKDAAVVW